MDIHERNRGKALAHLARLKPNTGHARNLRAKLGISDTFTPAPVVETTVKEVKKVTEVPTEPKVKRGLFSKLKKKK